MEGYVITFICHYNNYYSFYGWNLSTFTVAQRWTPLSNCLALQVDKRKNQAGVDLPRAASQVLPPSSQLILQHVVI